MTEIKEDNVELPETVKGYLEELRMRAVETRSQITELQRKDAQISGDIRRLIAITAELMDIPPGYVFASVEDGFVKQP